MPSQHPELNDADWLQHQYLELGRTRREIAAEIGCAPSTVGDAMRRFGIRKRIAPRIAGLIPVDWLRAAYVDQGRSMTSIAEEVGVSHPTIRRALDDAGIRIRDERRPAELEDRAWCAEHQHDSPKELARLLGCSAEMVRRAMQRHGLKPLRGADDLPYPEFAGAEWLSARHHDDGLTHGQIAERVGCSRTAVTQAMQRLGVPSRPPGRTRHALLSDTAWLERQVAAGRTITEIAGDVGCDWKSVREALERNELRPPRRAAGGGSAR